MFLDQLKLDLTGSLKAGRKVRVETLRFLLAAIRNFAIAKYGAAGEAPMTDADILEVVKKQVKTHQESIEAFEKGGRPELAAAEKAQLAILEEFLPKQISDEELMTILAPVVASGEQNFGLLMKAAMAAMAGRVDGGRVAGLLKKMLKK